MNVMWFVNLGWFDWEVVEVLMMKVEIILDSLEFLDDIVRNKIGKNMEKFVVIGYMNCDLMFWFGMFWFGIGRVIDSLNWIWWILFNK